MSIVAIIGLDGSGKTTQAMMLVDRLKREGYNAIYVKPNYFLLNYLFGLKIRKNPFISPRKNRVAKVNYSDAIYSKLQNSLIAPLGYLYALLNRISMAFFNKKIIVCDRYFYQFFYDLFGNSSNKLIKFFPNPDIAFFLNTSLDVLYSRMQNSFDKIVDKDYYEKVLNFLKMISKKNDFLEIKADKDEKLINEIIFQEVIRFVYSSEK